MNSRAEKNRQLVIALAIYFAFTLLMGAGNLVNSIGERDGRRETLEPIAGMLMGLLEFPVFCVGLPLGLARRWGLEVSFLPRGKRWLLGVAVIALYLVVSQQQSLERIVRLGIPPLDFLIHLALVHTIGGSLGLAVNGTLFNQVDEMLIVTAIIMTGLLAYMIVYELRHRGSPYRAGWWLHSHIEDRAEQ